MTESIGMIQNQVSVKYQEMEAFQIAAQSCHIRIQCLWAQPSEACLLFHGFNFQILFQEVYALLISGNYLTLCEEATRKSASRAWTSTTMWGTLWQASTNTFAPTSCAQTTMSSTGSFEATEKIDKFSTMNCFKIRTEKIFYEIKGQLFLVQLIEIKN